MQVQLEILKERKNILDDIASQLMEKETLNYEDFQNIIDQFTKPQTLQPELGLSKT